MLRELLRGFEAHAPQSVANMTIIPLVNQEISIHDVGTVNDIFLDRDSAYDRLTMGTSSPNPTIMPSGFTLITKERAQDRAVANKMIIPGKKTVDTNAFCVQSTQAGFMDKSNKAKQEMRMLPVTIRKAAYVNRNERNYSALWNSLAEYNTKVQVSGNYLTTFFEKLKDQLDQFIAEFELVPHQRGAIILINDRVIGIEISANPLAWSAQWETLIRDCYGSEAIVQQKAYKTITDATMLGDAETLEDLAARVTALETKEFEFAEKTINDVLAQTHSESQRQTVGGLSTIDVETDDFCGQAVRNSDSIIDLTLLSKDATKKGFKFSR